MILQKLFKIVPECSLKNKIRCFLYSFKTNDFRIYYKNCFVVSFDEFNLKFYNNPYDAIKRDLTSIKDYLKKYRPKKGDIVIDGGGYIGLFTLVASNLVGSEGKVIVFEPDTRNYKMLLNNLEVNKATNVKVINQGLWSKDTTLQLQAKGLGSSFFSGNINDPIIPVPVVSLDNELKRIGIKKVDFIKMDVEGAELEAIKGCKNTLKRDNVKLAIASYHIVNGQQTCFKLKEIFNRMGYKSETSHQKPLITYANKQI